MGSVSVLGVADPLVANLVANQVVNPVVSPLVSQLVANPLVDDPLGDYPLVEPAVDPVVSSADPWVPTPRRWWERCPGWSRPEKGEVRGRALRYMLTMALRDAGRSMTVAELVAHCEGQGVVFESRASKLVSDSLRWEMAWGRVRRLRRGVYCFGRIPRSTLRFIRKRLAELVDVLRPPVVWGTGFDAGTGSEAWWVSGSLPPADLGWALLPPPAPG